jgi:hypothetical protein
MLHELSLNFSKMFENCTYFLRKFLQFLHTSNCGFQSFLQKATILSVTLESYPKN